MVRVCVIGAGPGGMSFIREVQRLQKEDPSISIDLVCYDKQSTWGGQWNFSWRVGVDEFGEPETSKMYRGLWTNSPKEISEFEDYTMEDHFKKNLPSFLPREALNDYLQTYWKRCEMDKFDIRYNQAVRSVKYDSEADKFKVITHDLKNDRSMGEEIFDYVINCSGHFSIEHIPDIAGMETFPDTVLHTGYLKSFCQMKDKKIMVIGAGWSGSDAAIQSLKYGAKSVIVSYRSFPLSALTKFPPEIIERPEVRTVNGSEVTFIDDTTAQVDMIILATGYLHHYPYMSDELRLTGPNKLFPEGLHHGTLWLGGGNKKLFYIGATNQFLSYTIFLAQSRWTLMILMGKLKLREGEEMEELDRKYHQREADARSILDSVLLQCDWIVELAEESQLGIDVTLHEFPHKFMRNLRELGLDKYKESRYKSRFTGAVAAELFQPYMEIKDCSLEKLLSQY